MAYRALVSSQADLDSAHSTDINTFHDLGNAAYLLGGPVFSNPYSGPRVPNTHNSISAGIDNQYFANSRLPTIPHLLNPRGFSDDYDPFQQVGASSFVPHLDRHHNISPPATNYNNSNRERNNNWGSITPDFTAFPRLDSGLHGQELHSPTFPCTGHQHGQNSSAPPRTQQPRISQSPLSTSYHNTTNSLPRQPNRPVPEPSNDDYYLRALANGDFSSPSLPPINSSPLPRPPTRQQFSSLPRPLEIGQAMPTAATRGRRSSKSGLVDLTKEEPDLDSISGIDPTTPAMPVTRKRSAANAALDEAQPAAAKRRRSSASASGRVTKSRSRQTAQNAKTHSPFAEEDVVKDSANVDGDAIDLSNVAEVPDVLKAPKANQVKLGAFQCIICLEDASNLVVTHCGHLFCSQCLHTALHMDRARSTCPVCRTNVFPQDKKGKNQKSYYHLELKIMTANKKGKRPAGSQ
ncbi:hypothetical protein GGR54DRAFT_162771 [Hypoxylon sp. NC1633]|nr:hypothetical protein GGR54DRAFT_162771 [Hypoxylon sp. NC1633]